MQEGSRRKIKESIVERVEIGKTIRNVIKGGVEKGKMKIMRNLSGLSVVYVLWICSPSEIVSWMVLWARLFTFLLLEQKAK